MTDDDGTAIAGGILLAIMRLRGITLHMRMGRVRALAQP